MVDDPIARIQGKGGRDSRGMFVSKERDMQSMFQIAGFWRRKERNAIAASVCDR